MKKELELSGLRLVHGGLILQLISLLFMGRLASALMYGTGGTGIVSFVISAAALCIILAGVSRLREASPFFAKAKKAFLVQLIMQIVLIVFLSVLGAREWTVGNIAYTARSTIIEMLLAVLAILIVSIISRLISVRAMLRGCGHVAEQVNDPLFSIKCMKNWRLWYMSYLLMILIALAGVAMIVTVLRKTIENGAAGEDLTQAIFTNVSSSVLLVSIVVMAVLIFFLIAHILFIGKMRLTYREYHLEEVKETETVSQRPAYADYVKQQLGEYSADEDSTEADHTEADGGEPEVFEDGTDEYEDTREEETEEKRISGRRYRRIAEDPEEEEQSTGDIMEITKLFKKNKN